jgi:hypothetical protein
MCLMSEQKTYDVALWLLPPGGPNFPVYVADELPAAGPLEAVTLLMDRYGLQAVYYAAVQEHRQPGVYRYVQGVRRSLDGEVLVV